MADIVFRYPEMGKAVSDIQTLATQYSTIAKDFEQEFLAAIASWEGDSKDKMQAFINGAVMNYMDTTISKLLNGFAELLQANIDQMSKADTEIASNIPTTLS
ncbi:MAG: WXG100 family type VII secretion target [Acutalibacteraceae bacterium]